MFCAKALTASWPPAIVTVVICMKLLPGSFIHTGRPLCPKGQGPRSTDEGRNEDDETSDTSNYFIYIGGDRCCFGHDGARRGSWRQLSLSSIFTGQWELRDGRPLRLDCRHNQVWWRG